MRLNWHSYGDRLKDNGGHDLDVFGVTSSVNVIGHVTVRLPAVDFLWVVHSYHASI